MKKHLLFVGLGIISLMLISSCKKEDPNAPKACFVIPDEVYAGELATFNASCSENADSYVWDFGDGGSSTDINPAYTYMDDGSYNVSLTVSNDVGDSDQMSATVTVMAPAFIEHSGKIESDETWIQGVHIITGDVYVDGAILTIEPGAVIKFKAGNGLYIGYYGGVSGATLIANGTSGLPILFTSDAPTKAAGDWDFIGFYDGASKQSSMQYCTVEYGGGYSQNYGQIYIAETALSISNSIIRYSESHGFSLDDEGYFADFTNNVVEQVVESAIQIYANHAHTIGTGNNLQSSRGISVQGDKVENGNVRWLKQSVAFVLEGEVYVGSATGSALTLDPGVEIWMGGGTGLHFGYYSGTFGTLIAEGTQSEHIKITSSAPEVSRSAGDWDYIGFYDGAGTGSSLAYCDIEYGGGYSDYYGMINIDESGVSLNNSTITNSQSMGVSLDDEAFFTGCTGNAFQDNAIVPIEMDANYAHTIGAGNTFNTGPGIMVKGDKIEGAEQTWLKHNKPYILSGDIYIGSATGSKLSIAPGATVQFTEGSALYVGYYSNTYGILEADGEVGNEITFTSAAPAGFESAGDWDGIWFYDGATNGNIMDNCIVSYGGGYSDYSGNIDVESNTAGVPIISNCHIEYSESWGIYLEDDASPTLENNTFSNNALGDTN